MSATNTTCGRSCGTGPTWGTFPRYLARYVRELGVLSLEDCVAHLTGRAADRLRLTDRGRINLGYAADLVLFDPDTIADRADFTQPRQTATGIEYVLVNGVPTLEESRPTGALPGRSIRNSRAERGSSR
jgi:N-acyl-D-amino-acid deacylase